MTAFTAAAMASPPTGFSTTGGVPTVTPWVSFPYGPVRLGFLRGLQVKIWNGTTWVLAPPS